MSQKNESRIIPLPLKTTKFTIFFLPLFLSFHIKILFYELKISETKKQSEDGQQKNILSMHNCVHTHTCTFSDKQI